MGHGTWDRERRRRFLGQPEDSVRGKYAQQELGKIELRIKQVEG